MLKNTATFILYLLIVTVVLSIEQTYGLPLLYIGLALIFTTLLPRWFRQGWLLVNGVLMASLLHFSLAGGVLLLSLLFGLWYVASFFLKNASVRIVVCAVVGVGVLVLLLPFALTGTLWLLGAISSIMLILLTRFVIFIPDITNQSSYIVNLPKK